MNDMKLPMTWDQAQSLLKTLQGATSPTGTLTLVDLHRVGIVMDTLEAALVPLKDRIQWTHSVVVWAQERADYAEEELLHAQRACDMANTTLSCAKDDHAAALAESAAMQSTGETT